MVRFLTDFLIAVFLECFMECFVGSPVRNLTRLAAVVPGQYRMRKIIVGITGMDSERYQKLQHQRFQVCAIIVETLVKETSTYHRNTEAKMRCLKDSPIQQESIPANWTLVHILGARSA